MVNVNRETCIGCELCAGTNSEVFEMVEGKAQVKAGQEGNDNVQNEIDSCPSQSISR